MGSGELFDSQNKKKVFIIDGYGQIYRSYFAFITNPLKDKNGNNVSAIFGFFNIIMMLIRQYNPDYLIVAMDSKGKTFRHELYSQYKANRDKTPEDLHAQIPIIEYFLDDMKIPHYAQVGMEADDIVATICKNAQQCGIDAVMVTGDKDLLQLVRDGVSALRPPKKGEHEYKMCSASQVKELFGVEPTQIVDYLTILGDSSDNVPGIDGIGEKGAVKLLSEYRSLEEVYKNIGVMTKGMQAKLEAAKDHLQLSHDLILLKDDLFKLSEKDFDQYTTKGIDWVRGAELFGQIGADKLAKSAAKFAGGELGELPKTMTPTQVVEEEGPVEPAQKGKYRAITDIADLEKTLGEIADQSVVAFDFETTSADDMVAMPVGFSFANKACEACYVPLVAYGKRYFEDQEVKAILAKHLVRFKVVGQNIKYDLKVLRRWGVEAVHPYADTMLMAWLVDSASNRYNLDDLAKKYLNYTTIKYEDVVAKGQLFSDITLDTAVNYGAEDSDITLRLYQILLPKLQKLGLDKILFDLEMPLVEVLCNMELQGILLEPSRLESFKGDLENEIFEVQKDIFTLCNKEFNLNSPKQLQEILFVDRKLPTGKKTHSGFSTDSDVLEELSANTDDPVPPLILRYRMLNKLLSTYVLTLPSLINAQTGRIHTSFFQTGTATGRLSSKNPNLQNIPIRTEEGRKIRDAFVPKKGSVLMSADYSQIELVVLAHLSGDKNLKEAFIAGEDVHKATAAKIFRIFPEMVTSQQRRVAKTINFGIMYGMSAFRLSKDLKISRAEAKNFIEVYFEEYSGVRDFIDKVKTQAREDGYVRTAMGHIRYIPEIRSSNKTVLAGAERIAVNTIIQGTAAEIMKLAMIATSKAIEENGLKSRILLQVHDEMIFEVPAEEVEKMSSLVRSCMEKAYKLSIPLKVGLETGSSWGEMH